MSRLANISCRKVVNALKKAGFYEERQRGSHIVMRRDDPYAQVVVPETRTLCRLWRVGRHVKCEPPRLRNTFWAGRVHVA